MKVFKEHLHPSEAFIVHGAVSAGSARRAWSRGGRSSEKKSRRTGMRSER